MVLKLYGNSNSTCTKRVAIVLHEKKVPFEFINIDFAVGAHKKPDYLEKQPFGQVPYIVRCQIFPGSSILNRVKCCPIGRRRLHSL